MPLNNQARTKKYETSLHRAGIAAGLVITAGFLTKYSSPSPTNPVRKTGTLEQLEISHDIKLPDSYGIIEFEDFVAVTDRGHINPTPLGITGSSKETSDRITNKLMKFRDNYQSMIEAGEISNLEMEVFGDQLLDDSNKPLQNKDGKAVILIHDITFKKTNGETETINLAPRRYEMH